MSIKPVGYSGLTKSSRDRLSDYRSRRRMEVLEESLTKSAKERKDMCTEYFTDAIKEEVTSKKEEIEISNKRIFSLIRENMGLYFIVYGLVVVLGIITIN